MIYLTEDDYAIAEANGIKKMTVYKRVYDYDWDIQKAITKKPPGKDPERQKWRKVAIENKIPARLFNERVLEGWSYERAATTKVHTPKQSLRKATNAQLKVFTRAQLNKAERNGIKYGTALARVNQYGWTAERAVTEPTRTTYRRNDYIQDGS